MDTTSNQSVRSRAPCAVALAGVLCVAVAAHAQIDLVMAKGSATKNGKTCAGDMIFDTGASATIINRQWAKDIGLLDANFMPPVGTPKIGANPKPNTNPVEYTYELWCFTDVSIEAEDAKKRKCKSDETVYVSTSNDALGPINLLGVPWQTDVDACYRAVGQQLLWPWQEPDPADPKKPAVPKEDTKTEKIKIVIPETVFTVATASITVDLVPYTGLEYTVIPQSVADALGAPVVGSIDLAVTDPLAWARLAVGDQNGTEQTLFQIVQIDATSIGIGPDGGPIEVLVSNDANSDFGIMGDTMLTHATGPQTYVWASTTQTLYFNDPCAMDGTGLATGSIVNFPTAALCPLAPPPSDLSMVPADSTIFGYNAGPGFGLAQDIVLDCPNNTIDTIGFHLYSTGCPVGVPVLSGCSVHIETDEGGVPSGAVVAGPFTLFETFHAGIFRTVASQPDDCARAVARVNVQTDGLALPAGTYWVVMQAQPSCGPGPFMPMNTETGNSQTTPEGNAKVFDAGLWQPVLTNNGAGTPCGVSVFVDGAGQGGCYADCDGNGALNIFDYICFGNAYAANDPYADCDGNGTFNIFDYICFGNAYAAGCP